MNVTHIPLDSLQSTERNVRKTGGMTIEGLAASIKAHGLIQNLSVIHHHVDQDRYLVVVGGRRLQALQRLAKAGELPLALSDGIPCRIVSDDLAHETSLAENVIRQAMHPADECDAFAKLASEGCSVGEIAARFGQPELYIRQRLKLASVAPALIAEYRDGKATLEQMMALALTDDQELQSRVWRSARQEWQRRPEELRKAIAGKELALTSCLAKYIGTAAYEKAGGVVRRDLFGGDDDAYMVDIELAHKLAADKLERTAAKVRKEGWAWVETRVQRDYSEIHRFGRAPSAWKGSQERWADDVKAASGAMVSVGYNGHAEIERGLVRPEDRRAAAKAAGADVAGGRKARVAGELTFAAVQRLQAEAGNIIAAEVAESPRTALALLAADLAERALYAADFHGPRTWVHIRREATGRMPGNVAKISGRAPAATRMQEQEQAWRKKLPKKLEDLRPWLVEQEFDLIARLLAFLAAREIDLVDVASPNPKDTVADLAAVSKVDLAAHWEPTEEWLGTLPKAVVVNMVADAAGKKAAAPLLKLKKGQLPAAAVGLFPAGWLPKPLRPTRPAKTKRQASSGGQSA